MAAHVLALAGAKVCMLEAGDWFDCTKQSDMFKWPYNAPHRGAGGKEKPFGYFDATLVGGWQVPGEPYTNAPGTRLAAGGARACWAAAPTTTAASRCAWAHTISNPYSRDGKGFDWPITYDDLAPYYDKAEELIGVFGTHEGLENTPDGKFQPAPAPRGYERVIKIACDKLRIPCIPSRLAILTQPLNGRPACHYCAQCGRACGVNANFNSPGVHIFPAMKTGNLEVRTGAMAREVVVGRDGLARGVSYIDKKTRQRSQRSMPRSWCWRPVAARRRASCSIPRAAMFPNGIANSSGLVGRYLMDTVGSAVGGYLPILEDLPPQNEDGVGGMHMYMPWWLYQEQKAGKMPFARGYHIEFGGGRGLPGAGELGGSEQILGGGYGVELKRNLRKIYGANMYFDGRGEMIPNEDSYCEIDPGTRRSVGHPGAPFPLQMEPGRNPAGQAHAGNLPGDHRSRRRQSALQVRPRRQLGDRQRRRDHSRGGRGQDGRQSENFRAESVLPGLGLQESVSSPTQRRLSAMRTRTLR